jgi:hypothetical protein
MFQHSLSPGHDQQQNYMPRETEPSFPQHQQHQMCMPLETEPSFPQQQQYAPTQYLGQPGTKDYGMLAPSGWPKYMPQSSQALPSQGTFPAGMSTLSIHRQGPVRDAGRKVSPKTEPEDDDDPDYEE